MRNCRDKNLLKPALYAFLTAEKDDNLHISACRHVGPELYQEGDADDDFLDFRVWCNAPYAGEGPFLNVHVFLLWLIFKRKLVKCPPELAEEFM